MYVWAYFYHFFYKISNSCARYMMSDLTTFNQTTPRKLLVSTYFLLLLFLLAKVLSC